jgi:PST family polysaccharide transporter
MLIAVAAPIASFVFQAPVTGLLLILALVAPIAAAGVPPQARLQNELRFRALATIDVSSTALLVVLQILFACLGFGAYSWIIPQPIRMLYRTAAMWMLAPTRVRRSPQFRRWRHLMPDGVRLIMSDLLRTMVYQGDYMMLAFFFSTTVVGVYFFAFRLSTQTMQVLTLNLARVLFPALSSLQLEQNRQRAAFLRAASALATVGLPVCLLQAVLAQPVVYLLFEEKWYPAIVVLEVLALAMPLRLLLDISESMIKAQGRFRMFLRLSAAYSVTFLALVYAAAVLADEETASVLVAAAVAVSLLIFGPLHVYLAIRPAGGTWRDVLGVYAAPGASAVFAVGLGWGLARLVPAEPGRNLGQVARLLVTSLTTVVVYLPLMRRTNPAAWHELKQQVLRFRRRTP